MGSDNLHFNSICCLDHGDHVHVRFNTAARSSEWHKINCPHDYLLTLIPSTSIHVHEEEEERKVSKRQSIYNPYLCALVVISVFPNFFYI